MPRYPIVFICCLFVITATGQETIKRVNKKVPGTQIVKDAYKKVTGTHVATGDTSGKTVAKTFSQEIAAPPGSVVRVRNTIYNIEIRTWQEPTVKFTTILDVPESGYSTITDEQMLNLSGVSLRSLGNRVELVSIGDVVIPFKQKEAVDKKYNAPTSIYSSNEKRYTRIIKSGTGDTTATIHYQDPEVLKTPMGRKTLMIYLPATSRLDIDNSLTDLTILNDIADAEIQLVSSNMSARNFGTLRVFANSYNIYMSDAKEAKMDLAMGSFSGGEIGTLELKSRGSELEYTTGRYLYVQSENDRISVDEIGSVSGNKQFGELRIGTLSSDLDLECRNADVKIRRIVEDATKIRIVNKYATVRLPITLLTNFAIDFKGENSVVYSGFDRASVITLPDLRVSATGIMFGDKAPSAFTAEMGTITGKHTTFQLSCDQCTIDFK